MIRYNLSRWFGNRIIPLIGVVLLGYSASYYQGERVKDIIWSDMEGYYLYLPATFINGGFKDLKCIYGCSVPNQELGWTHSKYTYGVALMEMPFFAIGHLAARVLGFETDGYSKPYAFSIILAGLIYFLVGLLLLRKFLSVRFSTWAVNLVLLSIALGTNAYYYATVGAGMSHVFSFFLFSLLLVQTDNWRADSGFWNTAALALISALIVFIRPTGIIILIWIPFADLRGMDSLTQRAKSIWQSGLAVLIPAITAALYLPQFYYWKQFSGSWFTWSYGDEGFTYWSNPKILEVLFSHQNGLFMYSPVVALALIGLLFMWKRERSNTILIATIFALATYAFASWWAWWFGGAFGHRAYVEYFAVLAIPMAWTFEHIGKLTVTIKVLSTVSVLCLIYSNARMILHYAPPWDGPDWTWQRYWEIWEWVWMLNG